MNTFRKAIIVLASLIAGVQLIFLARAGWAGDNSIGSYLGLAGMILLILAMLFSQRHAARSTAARSQPHQAAEQDETRAHHT